MGFFYFFTCAITILMTIFPYSSPIMVKFGTKGGPIIPAAPTTQAPSPKTYYAPAPVYEFQDDIPNPSTYRPIQPNQYRTKIYKYRPNPNLILGTPVDQKYKGYDKYALYIKPKKAFGLSYTGPQVFEPQEYERENYNKKYVEYLNLTPEATQQRNNENNRYVPQIGIAYSSGVRYYVPQIFYNGDDIDNSVYEANDLKYYYHQKRSY